MKRKILRIKEIFAEPKTYWLASLCLAFISGILYLVSTEVTLNQKSFNDVLPANLKNYKLVNQNLDRQFKNFTAQIIAPESSWFYQIELELSETEYPSIVASLKDRSIQVDHEKSLYKTLIYKPHTFIWSLLGMLFGFGVFLHMYRGYRETAMSRINKYQVAEIDGEHAPDQLTFNDVAGIDEVKEQIEEIVDLFKDSSKIENMGGKVPKGILLSGPPGTGKTLLAKVTANECGASFLSVSGSEFVEMYVGVGAKRVRELFLKARSLSPCIIFIDEIDSVAGKRGVGGNDEREQTLNQLLVEMDGFNSQHNILVIAATNQLDKLDPAILRPGRFDRQVMVHLPDINGREKILNIYLNKTICDQTIVVREIAKITSGFSGADLANLVNEAILHAAKNHKKEICQKDLIWAKDKILMGSERKIQMNKDDRIHTAYHEIGHALVSRILKVGTVSQVSIVPRGKALGVTQLEQEDILSLSKDQAINQLAMMMGGRVAEKIFFKHLSTGAVNDLQRCFNLARNMVSLWGMSEMGPIALDDQAFRLLSENTKEAMDKEIIKIIHNAEALALDILNKNSDLVVALSNVLLDKENLTLEEFAELTKTIKV